jgi:transposase
LKKDSFELAVSSASPPKYEIPDNRTREARCSLAKLPYLLSRLPHHFRARAIGIVAQLVELFEIDAQARKQGLSQEDRQLLRLEKSKPLLEQIKSQIQAARTSTLPKSVLAKACNYTLTLWTRLTRFMEHPELELSNNLAEKSMRPVALGRRN